jgi:hypothetical protein
MTFSNFYDHTDPLFIKLNILKIHDLVFYWSAAFMHDFYNGNLPEIFHNFFTSVKEKHNHNTRLTYSIAKRRTNYGKFNIRFRA